MKINKTEQGITIISLVVTVIILLILAGVAIRSLSGDNGLISRTKQTVEESKKAEYQEGLDTIGLGVKLKTAKDHLTTVQYMDEYMQELNQEKTKEGSLFKESTIKRKNDETIRVETKEGYIYYVREDETIYVGKVGEIDEGNIAELKQADIIFSYSHGTWTNQDVQVTISLSETVQNKENYRLEYSKDNKNWSKYAEGTTITMTQNGKIYARTKDISGDIKLERGYAEGEVTIIDKQAPIPGTLIMKMASLGTPYEEGTEVYQNVAIEIIDGQDEEEGSGHKVTTCTITGGRGDQTNQTRRIILKASEEKYNITVTTEDNAGNISTSRAYILNPTYSKETKPMEVEGGTYYLTEGFKLAEDSANKISEGIVIEDKQGNEWVWVPCHVAGGVNQTGTVLYDRYAFTRTNPTWDYRQTKLTEKDSDGSYKIIREDKKNSYYFHEGLSNTSTEYQSIFKYGGYYIGRYEAGDKNLSDLETPKLREESDKGDNQDHVVSIKKDQVPYNWVTQAQCITLSEGMTSIDGTDTNKLDGKKVFTKLCSSYSWDTALMFIQKTHTTYGSDSKTNTGTIVDNTKESGETSEGILKTGSKGSVCSIYDMGGNLFEYTTEFCTREGYPHVYRGGNYNIDASHYPVGYRPSGYAIAKDFIGFRPTLFIR